jgi:hypothetical protein
MSPPSYLLPTSPAYLTPNYALTPLLELESHGNESGSTTSALEYGTGIELALEVGAGVEPMLEVGVGAKATS